MKRRHDGRPAELTIAIDGWERDHLAELRQRRGLTEEAMLREALDSWGAREQVWIDHVRELVLDLTFVAARHAIDVARGHLPPPPPVGRGFDGPPSWARSRREAQALGPPGPGPSRESAQEARDVVSEGNGHAVPRRRRSGRERAQKHAARPGPQTAR